MLGVHKRVQATLNSAPNKPLHLTPWLIFENLSFICDKTNVQSQNGGAGELYVSRAEVNENRGIIHLRPEPRQPDIRRTKQHLKGGHSQLLHSGWIGCSCR